MSTIISNPQVVAAFIGGVFALICKLLERKTGDRSITTSRGFSGWLIIIAAAAAVVLSLYSIAASRQQLSASTWSEGDKKGTIIIGDTLICYGYVDAIGPNNEHREFTVAFPSEFAVTPTVTDSILPQGSIGKGTIFSAYERHIETKGFTIKVWTGSEVGGQPEVVRYGWVATGPLKR